jgi:hypothetical protein
MRLLMGGTLLGATSPLESLISGFVDGLINEAHAAENKTSATPRRYLQIGLPQGPSRWVYDLPLHPLTATPDITLSPFIMTAFQNGAGVYRTVPIQSTPEGPRYFMPSLWAASMPTTGGASVPMSTLLDHCLIMRGIRMPADSHASNHALMFRPNPSSHTLAGAVADEADEMIPAISLSRLPPYRSRSGIPLLSGSPTGLVSRSGLGTILNNYARTPSAEVQNLLSRRQSMQALMDSALEALKKRSTAENPASNSLWKLNSRADEILSKGLPPILEEWARTIPKYSALIFRCANAAIPGVTNVALPQNDPKAGLVLERSPVGAIIRADTTLEHLAEHMALTEVLFRLGVSRSITFPLSAILSPTSLPGLRIHFDEHTTGAHASVILNSFLFLTLSTLLHELISVLKGGGLYEETVIQLTSEFPRTPPGLPAAGAAPDLRGTGHGWAGNVTTLFSGALQGLSVIGKCQYDPARGHWGLAARAIGPTRSDYITVGNVASTTAQLLRVESPTPNFPSLVSVSNGKASHADEVAPRNQSEAA